MLYGGEGPAFALWVFWSSTGSCRGLWDPVWGKWSGCKEITGEPLRWRNADVRALYDCRGGRVAGLSTGRDERTGGEGPGCCPPEEESDEVLLVGWDLQEEWGSTFGDEVAELGVFTGKEGAVVMPASSDD